MSDANRPDRYLVRQVIGEEALAAGLTLDQALNAATIHATSARRRAFRRIKSLTGCSTYGLAAVFGCDHGAVLDALREPTPQRRKPAPAGFRHAPHPQHATAAALACFAAIDEYQRRGGA